LMIFILSTRLRSRCGLAPGCRLWVIFGLRRACNLFPLYPNERTSRSTNATSEQCQLRTFLGAAVAASGRYANRVFRQNHLFLRRVRSRRMWLPLKRDVPKSPFGANEQHWCHRQARSLKRPTFFRFRTTIHQEVCAPLLWRLVA
jgi:hypothetical protein